ncbi:MAG: flagellar protein FlaG [Sulfuritalea sp.]|jgi:flagellar protein FlaG|uniref:Flagellar protein FlaG protein n=2 Tax=Sulfuritalea hydrogenivorans TaxID=748811 RepID=W0SCW1_9PROT|nr:flagellar protein FlaG [Sulfuritalea sp.]BAO28772.1 flagellar protein FlaG protein [Sulfuritalea hydrogenivorans sk43H]
MSIQSLNGAAGNTPQPAQARSNPAPVQDAAMKLPQAPVQSVQPTQKPAPEQLQKALEALKQAVPIKSNALTFSLDDSSGQTIARVVDSETGEVIRQIPSKELLEIARAIDKMQGMLLKQKA